MEVLGDAAKEEEIIEGTNHSIAETIIENTTDKNQNILVMDSMQSVTSKGVEEGITYLSIMESNLEVLKEALKYDGFSGKLYWQENQNGRHICDIL